MSYTINIELHWLNSWQGPTWYDTLLLLINAIPTILFLLKTFLQKKKKNVKDLISPFYFIYLLTIQIENKDFELNFSYKVGNAIAHWANIAIDKGMHVFKINRLEEKTKTNYNIKHILVSSLSVVSYNFFFHFFSLHL